MIDLGKERSAVIDAADVPLVQGKLWRATLMSGKWYAVYSFAEQRDGRSLSSRLYLHQAIIGKEKGKHIDHKNDDGLDNRRKNIRHCTIRQNQQNRHAACGLSRFKGVIKKKQPSTWGAHIRANGKMLWLGTFYSEEDAARAYDDAARLHFGEFARCNFPITGPAGPGPRGGGNAVQGTPPLPWA
jgi:hypothetical protein